MNTLTISRASAGYIRRGHPWIRPDRFTRGLERLRPGEAVTLQDERGQALAAALADPKAPICARAYDLRDPKASFDPVAAVERAWRRRADLHGDPDTDCYRLIHGEADGLPALRAERYGAAVVVLATAPCAVVHAEAVASTLQALMPSARILMRTQLNDLRLGPPLDRPFGAWRADPEEVVLGRELGVAYPLRPWSGLATGLYVDQRPTRAWLRGRARGARVLNLFAYTGAFSVCALHAGAASAVDVDLSGPALARAHATAEMAGVAERHRIIQDDCRAYLQRVREEFDLIVIDPPTAAQGGGGWVLRRDYPELLGLAWAHVAQGGLLVSTANTVGGSTVPLERWLDDCCARGRRVSPSRGAGDVPRLAGFPEGDPYRIGARERA